jgi:hypothetical protein
MFEIITPFRRMALMMESGDPLVAQPKRMRQAAILEIERALGPALKLLSPSQRRKLMTKLHVVCAWLSRETLRVHHGVSPVQTRRLVTLMAPSILRDAFNLPKRPPDGLK